MSKINVPLNAVILVGGEGTRLRPLTCHTPKSMVPVLNRPFLEHTIAYLKKYGVDSVILAMSYLPEAIQGYFGDGSALGVPLTYSVEDSPLGTAGAVKKAEAHLGSTFAVLNGDIFTDLDIADMIAYHRRQKAKVTIALTWVDNPCAFGVVEIDRIGKVQRFIEKPPPDQVTSHWINAGIYILESEVLKHVPVSSHYMFEKGLFPLLLELGEPVYGYSFDGYWLDMGTPEKYLCLNHDLLRSKAKSVLAGVLSKHEVSCGRKTVVHPTARIIGPAVIADGCRIDQGAQLIGPVVMASDGHIGENASIGGTVLWRGVRIGDGAVLKQCVIGSNTTIKNNARVINRVVVE